jgi:hypothetical protein
LSIAAKPRLLLLPPLLFCAIGLSERLCGVSFSVSNSLDPLAPPYMRRNETEVKGAPVATFGKFHFIKSKTPATGSANIALIAERVAAALAELKLQ